MQQHNGLCFCVGLVVGECGFDQEFFSHKLGRGVAALADIPCRAKTFYRRRDGCGIAIETDFEKLFCTVYLGRKECSCARTNVTFRARHVRVCGDFVGRILRMHDVAGLAAKLGRIHVRRTAVRGDGNHQKVGDRSHQYNVQPVPKNPVVEIDLWKMGWNLAGDLELPAADKYAHRDQEQPANKQSRQKKEEDDAQVGVFVGQAEDLDDPIGDHRYAGCAGNSTARETDRVVAEEERRPYPALTEFLKQWHFVPQTQDGPPVGAGLVEPSDSIVLFTSNRGRKQLRP